MSFALVSLCRVSDHVFHISGVCARRCSLRCCSCELIAREIGFDLEVSADHSQDGDVNGVREALEAGADLNFQDEVLTDNVLVLERRGRSFLVWSNAALDCE